MLRANESQFQTGWFIESVLSATVVVFAVRTRLPFTRSRPSRAMLWATLAVAAVVLLWPYSPLAAVLEFHPLHWTYLLAIGVIVGLYFGSAEMAKRWFFKRYE